MAFRRSSDAAARAPGFGLGAVLAAVLAGAAFAGAARAAAEGGAACLAKALIAKIPPGERIALVPFGPPATAIPREDADRIYDEVARALFEESGGRHVFTARNRRDAVWEDWQAERARSDYDAFFEKRKAGVTVRCKVTEPPGEVLRLTCTAHPVGEESRLSGEESRLSGDVYAPLAAFRVGPLFGYAFALTRLGIDLAKGAPAPAGIASVFIADGETGQRSSLTEDMGRRIRAVVEARFEARRRILAGRRNMGRDDDEPSGPPGGYALRGALTWPTGETAALAASLRDGGARATSSMIEIERKLLPSHLIDDDPKTRPYRASGRAVPSAGFEAESARQAAEHLARARVVAQALGLPAPEGPARSEADGMRALRWALQRGIPADERFPVSRQDADAAWEVVTEARVVVPGRLLRPEFKARLEADELRAGAQLRVDLLAQGAVHAAVFAWGADGKVFRLFPDFRQADLAVPAGGRMSVPSDERCPVRVGPMPGRRASHEAVVVVAAHGRLPFEGLAPSFCHEAGKAPPQPVSGGAFLAELARLDLGRAAVAVLPYRVER